jgi:predicted ATPase
MEGKTIINSLRVKNLLSFGETQDILLKPLNVLIGPNGSGKSNLIEAIILLQAAAKDFSIPFAQGGGINEWLWKGANQPVTAEMEALINYPESDMPLRYKINFSRVGYRVELIDEAVENEKPRYGERDVYFFYRYQNGKPVFNFRSESDEPGGIGRGRQQRLLRREDLDPGQSVLSQRKDPDHYPEITYLGELFSKFRFYRDWILGRHNPARSPQPPDLEENYVWENGRNLAVVMNNLINNPGIKRLLLEKLKIFNDYFEDITTGISGGSVLLYLHERGLNESIPATRLSDGTLHYLCLIAMLCHPSPPPLICIEEPELGLHPDILPTIADLLVEASQRSQIIVTTHSDVLISALTDYPESVLVCERDISGTQLRRLEKEQLEEWLQKYRLGELWRMGEIGGNP